MTDQGAFAFKHEDLAEIPETTWEPPTELPDHLHGLIGFDLETRDRGLAAGQGPGWAWRGGGHVVGYAVVADNFRGYLPVAHEGGGNLDPDLVRRWLNAVLGDESQAKVGANVMYDVGWARRDGVTVRGPVYDVQWAEALLDEHRWGYTLNGLAKTHLNEEKDEGLLQEAAAAWGVDPKAELWRLPAPYVGPYAEADADLARRVWLKQAPLLRAEGLWELSELEHSILPLYVDMRWRGVRVDVDRAERLERGWMARYRELTGELTKRVGRPVDVWSGPSLAAAFREAGVDYRTTEKGNPSFPAAWLEGHEHWLPRAVVEARQVHRLASGFARGAVLDHVHDGRVHGEFHPLRGDRGGTVTGRLSSSNPNLQQVPSRTEEGRQVRKCFLPEEGELWAKKDYSQQEPRLLVHFASLVRHRGEPLPGVNEFLCFYQSPDADAYSILQGVTGLPRGRAKVLTLARIYGRGTKNTARELDVSYQEAQEYFDTLDREAPFIKEMASLCQERVRRRGYVRSLLGRKSRFPNYEPADWSLRDGRSFPRWRAKQVWPNEALVRARMHKALNSLIQPSAADQTKTAMALIWREGLGHHLLIQVHDELDSSVPDESTARRLAELMEHCVKLAVPSRVDVTIGKNWGGDVE